MTKDYDFQGNPGEACRFCGGSGLVQIDGGEDSDRECLYCDGEGVIPHDTLDDQIAYEQEHGTREYRLAEELHREMGHALTMMAFSNCATTRDVGRWHAKVQQLRDALAPRPPITPTGSIDDVPWTETDQ